MVGFVDFLTYTRMARLGFYFHRQPYSDFFKLFPLRPVALTARKKSPSKTISYWFRPHTSKTKLPIVFIHGIGIGKHGSAGASLITRLTAKQVYTPT